MNIVRQTEPAKETSLLRDWDPFRSMRDLLRWDPFREIAPLSMGFVPSVDVKETANEYIFKADVPGMKEQDIEISLTGNRMSISGKREEEKKTETDTYYAMERHYGSFRRTFTLPEGVNTEDVKADLMQGVLTVTVPKKAIAESKRINVTAKAEQKGETKH